MKGGCDDGERQEPTGGKQKIRKIWEAESLPGTSAARLTVGVLSHPEGVGWVEVKFFDTKLGKPLIFISVS